MVVPVEELQRGDLLGEVWRAGEGTQLPEVPQGLPMASLVAGRLASGVYRQDERFGVAAVAGLLDRSGRLVGS